MVYSGNEAFLDVTICVDNFKTGFEAPGQIDFKILINHLRKQKF